jgi:hypothetical protein
LAIPFEAKERGFTHPRWCSTAMGHHMVELDGCQPEEQSRETIDGWGGGQSLVGARGGVSWARELPTEAAHDEAFTTGKANDAGLPCGGRRLGFGA